MDKPKKDYALIKGVLATMLASVSVTAIGVSAKAIIDVEVLKTQRIEDRKGIDKNGEKIDNLQKEMNNNFKTVIGLLK